MIELSILIAFAVLFLNATTWEGQIFEDVANWLDTKLPEAISKPLYGCPICMSFWWGSAAYLLYHRNEIFKEGNFNDVEMVLVVFAAAGINAFIVNLNNYIEKAGTKDDV